MSKKIKNNKSFQKISQEINIFKSLSSLLSLSSKLKPELDKMQSIDMNIINIPDEFNEFFNKNGWCASESINMNLMETCVVLAKNKKIKEAEDKLVESIDEDFIQHVIRHLKTIKGGQERWDILQKAKKDHIEGRYYSSVMVVLSVIDGIVNDIIPEQKGAFAEGVTLTTEDSVAGHETGLSNLISLMARSRKKTNSDSLSIPYRNGILHGRDLNFDNQKTSAKCWYCLMVIKDWATALRDKKKAPIEENKSWKEIFQTMKRTRQIKKETANWKKRTAKELPKLPSTQSSENYTEGTPEKALVDLLEFWQSKNYGKMASLLTSLSEEPTVSRRAGELAKKLKTKEIIDFELLRIDEQSMAGRNIYVRLSYNYDGNKVTEDNYKFRMLFKSETTKFTALQSEGSWKLLDMFFSNILYR